MQCFKNDKNSNFSAPFPTSYPSLHYPTRDSHRSTEERSNSAREPTRDRDEPVIAPRPVIREEDLHRMDDIGRDASWVTQDELDYE